MKSIDIDWSPLHGAVTRILPADEQANLILKFQSGDKKAGDTIIRNHAGLILSMVKKFSGLGEYQELLQCAMIGMCDSMLNFNVNDGRAKFSTYAVIGMRQRILKYIGRHRHLIIYINTQTVQRAADALSRAESHIRYKYGSGLSEYEVDEKVREFLGVDEIELLRAKLHHHGEYYIEDQFVSQDSEEDSLVDIIPDTDPTPEEMLIEHERSDFIKHVVNEVMSEQDDRTKDVMIRRHVKDETWTTIAKDYNITQQGISSSMVTKRRNIKRSIKSRLLLAGHEA